MKLFTQWLISTFLFGGTLFFAAGAPVIGAEGAGDGLDLGDLGDGTDDGAGDAEGADASGGSGDSHQRESDSDLGDDSQQAEGRDQHRSQEEPEVQEFKGSVSARLKNLTKQAPELGQVFQKYPKLQEQIEATFRREAALREVFPTVAEARQMREHFPNGLADVQQLHADVAEVETLDKDFYTRDREGNFPGHTKIIDGMFADDREAAVSLFRSLPKEWARLDRESYNEVMGKVVGVTLDNSRAVADLADALESKDPKRIEASATKFLNWADAFSREKPRPSADEERLNRDRASFKQQTAERDREEGQKFHTSFVSESRKLQMQTIKGHPAVKRLLESKTVTEQKKSDIVEQVRQSMEKLLGKSSSFMRKLQPLYKSRNMDEVLKLQKSAWGQQWLLNRMVRSVFAKEIPQLVTSNREAVRRRAGAPASKTPVKSGEKKDAPVGSLPAKQISGRWYRDGGRGAAFTTAEVLSGKHQQA
jgi:hypothetical protein